MPRLSLIHYHNAQIILIGAREPDIIKKDIGVEINYDKNELRNRHQLTYSPSSKYIKNKFQ